MIEKLNTDMTGVDNDYKTAVNKTPEVNVY
jgi:hypothetical protein